jgi:peptidoglycan/LPS O-acetylase OafA/YrhL
VLVNLGYRLALESAETQGWLDGSSMLATTVLPNQLPGRWAEFALGMVAAELHASGRLEAWTEHRHRMLAAMLAMVPVALFASRLAVGHVVYGVLFTLLLMLVLTSGTRIAQVFASPPLVAIGTMSYSLYLVHQPLIQVLGHALALEAPDASPTIVIFLVAWALYWIVERHTLHSTRSVVMSGAAPQVPKGSAPMPPSGRAIDQGVTLA